MIIRPQKLRKRPDPYIALISGTRGPCALCTNYSDLTENHVPPEALGNHDRWNAQSYLVASAANDDLIFGRRFYGGIRFRTLCKGCNNGLGGREDRALIHFYDQVRKLIESPLLLLPRARVSVKPNLIYRGLLAHMVSANDNGIPSAFDIEARDLFFGRKSLNRSSWSLFYWIYKGPELSLCGTPTTRSGIQRSN